MQNVLKTPTEKKTLSVDFTPVLATSETIDSDSFTVNVIKVSDGSSVTSTLLDTGASTLSGNIIYFRTRNGDDGEVYKIAVSTGATNQSNVHEEDILLVISDDINMLSSVDELKRSLGITDSTKDTLLFELVKAASDYFENVTRRQFNFKEYTLTAQPEEVSNELLLQVFPVASITSVVVDGTTLDAQTGGQDTYVVFSGGVLKRVDGGTFPKAPYKTIVTYKAGYKVLPEDIRHVVKKVASAEYTSRLKEGVKSESVGSYRITFKDDPVGVNHPDVQMIIERYKLRLF